MQSELVLMATMACSCCELCCQFVVENWHRYGVCNVVMVWINMLTDVLVVSLAWVLG